MTMMNENPGALIPELLLVFAAVVGLLAGSFLPRNRQGVVRSIAVLACLTGAIAAAADLTRPVQSVFDDTYVVDVGLGAVRIVVLASIVLTIGLAGDQVSGAPARPSSMSCCCSAGSAP